MKNYYKLITLFCVAFISQFAISQEKTITLTNNFDKVIVSPHIEAIFVQGDEPSIEVESMTVSLDKFNYEVVNNTLQVYLEGAKTVTKNKKIENDNWKMKVPLYKNTTAKVTITYVNVDVFSVRGEEKIAFESPLDQDKCILRIYGESEVLIKEAKLNSLRVTIYGESHLVIDSGSIKNQKITAYGSSKVRSLNAKTQQAKITAYGEGTYQVNASDRLKVTSYGEATILYKGNAELKKGIIIGESTVRRINE